MIDSRLRVLQLVAHYGTVTAAAQALHFSPSAVSHQLRQLAKELGVELFAPSGRGVRLTAAARTVLRHAEVLFAEQERLYSELASGVDELDGTFTMCGFSTAASRLLPPAAAALRKQHPELRVRVIEAEPSRCFDLLLAEQADLALLTATAMTPSSSDSRFDQSPLLDDPLDLVVPEGHPLAEHSSVALTDAAEEDWIVGRPESAYYALVLSACMTAGFSPNIAHFADEWDTGMTLVSYGLGIILVPRLARLHSDWSVVRIPLRGDPAPARRILATTRMGGKENPLVRSALKSVLDTGTALLPPV